MNRFLHCPHCASDDLEAIEVDHEMLVLAVEYEERGTTGPRSLS